jgi:hypothetical protein
MRASAARFGSHDDIWTILGGESADERRVEPGSDHEVFSSQKAVQTLPPLKASTDMEIVFNAVGFSGVELAQDRQTLGWTINVENCCTSYSIPLRVVVLSAPTHHREPASLPLW